VGSDAVHPIVISLWGEASSVGKPSDVLYVNPAAHDKHVLLRMAKSYVCGRETVNISYEAVRFVMKPNKKSEPSLDDNAFDDSAT
jgi:hypothetical protein